MYRSQRALQYALLLLGTLVLLMSGCTSENTRGNPPPLVFPAQTQTPTPSPQAVTLKPVTGLLGPPPADCQLVQPPGSISYQPFPGLSFKGSSITLRGDGQAWIYPGLGVQHLNSDGVHPFPSTPVSLIVGPDPTQPITLQGQDQRTGTPIWFQIVQYTPLEHTSTPTTNLELAPGESDDEVITADGNHWDIWRIVSLIVVKAGCYQLEASWPAGEWTMTFAAGR
jgi:hypothetical protein